MMKLFPEEQPQNSNIEISNTPKKRRFILSIYVNLTDELTRRQLDLLMILT